MNSIALLNSLKKYPVFGAEEVSQIQGSNRRYANLVLTRLYTKNIIKRVAFGKYTLCNLAQTIATHLITPSYITGWYALRVHGLTEQLPNQIDVLIAKKKNNIIVKFGNEKIRYLTVDKKYSFGFYNEVSEQYAMNIACIEKAIIDCLYFGLAPLSVVLEAIKLAKDKISFEMIKKFCLKFKNKQFLKKIGVIFDSLGYDLYNYFKRHLDYNPLYIDKRICSLLDKSKLRKWRIKCQ